MNRESIVLLVYLIRNAYLISTLYCTYHYFIFQIEYSMIRIICLLQYSYIRIAFIVVLTIYMYVNLKSTFTYERTGDRGHLMGIPRARYSTNTLSSNFFNKKFLILEIIYTQIKKIISKKKKHY
jgi:hypothetical protein